MKAFCEKAFAFGCLGDYSFILYISLPFRELLILNKGTFF